jgi:hypothetical protein
MSAMYADYAIDLTVDVVAIFWMSYVLYFRRHLRADLLLAYVPLNIGIFVAIERPPQMWCRAGSPRGSRYLGEHSWLFPLTAREEHR